eukprot:1252039-Amphidinium_carterae.1
MQTVCLLAFQGAAGAPFISVVPRETPGLAPMAAAPHPSEPLARPCQKRGARWQESNTKDNPQTSGFLFPILARRAPQKTRHVVGINSIPAFLLTISF